MCAAETYTILIDFGYPFSFIDIHVKYLNWPIIQLKGEQK